MNSVVGMRQAIVCILIGVFALATVVDCAEYYISPFGSDSNSGTSRQSPFLTLSKALSASSSGDTISAANGYYTGSSNVDLSITDRVIVGDSTSGVVFQTDTTVFTVDGNTALENLTLKGPSSSAVGVAMSSQASLTVSNVTFTVLGFGITLDSRSYNLTVSNCRFDHSVSRGVYHASTSGDVMWDNISINKSSFSTIDYPLYFSFTYADFLSQITVSDSIFVTSPIYINWYQGANMTLFQGCTFANITSSFDGGAVHIEARSAFAFDDCVFSNCASVSSGGAIYFEDDTTLAQSSLNVTNCRFIGNSANGGGSGAVNSKGTPLTLSNSVFAFNKATTYGGAIYADDYYNSQAGAYIDKCFFFANTASSSAGAVYLGSTSASSSISNSVFAFNTCGGDGGAILTVSGTYSFSATSFIGNLAGGYGGALDIGTSALVSSQAVSMIGNSASNGGGLYVGNGATLTASAMTFINNIADLNGGGLYAETASLSLQYASFLENNAESGGGLYSSGTSSINVFGSIFKSNVASTEGGGYACAGGGVNLGFVSFIGNEAPQGSAYSCSGTCGTFTSGVYVASNNDIYGCSSDFVQITADEVEAMASEHLALVPSMTVEEAAAILAGFNTASAF